MKNILSRQFYILMLNIMAFGENPTPVETTEKQNEILEQKISNKAVTLHNELSKLASDSYIKIPEEDGSQTRLQSELNNISHFGGPETIGPELTFVLKNVEGKNGNKKFIIKVDSYGKLTINGDNITAEESMNILNKIEENINQYKEYKIKKLEEEKRKKIEENTKKQEEEFTKADEYINSIDF